MKLTKTVGTGSGMSLDDDEKKKAVEIKTA